MRLICTATLSVWMAAAVYAAPPLVTIQDVVYRPNGARFSGLMTITTNAFETADLSAIGAASLTARVIDGNVRVQLVPVTNAEPPSYYTVIYTSDGKTQFQELWAVPPSDRPLRIREVRVTFPPTNPIRPILQSDVSGLLADLGARPQRGANFGYQRVPVINSQGKLESVVGVSSDCVHVDGTSGPCGAGGSSGVSPDFVDADVLVGPIDGVNATFTLSAVPNPASSLLLYRNGVLLKPGADFTINGAAVQFVPAAVPRPGDLLQAFYRRSGSSGSGPGGPPEILCSRQGTGTGSAAAMSLGTCTIPANALAPGDRVEIRFEYSYEGSTSGYAFDVFWGNTLVAQRTAGAADAASTGRVEAAVHAQGVLASAMTWGTALALTASLTSAADSLAVPLTLDFRGRMLQSGSETVTLRNYTVIRYPAN